MVRLNVRRQMREAAEALAKLAEERSLAGAVEPSPNAEKMGSREVERLRAAETREVTRQARPVLPSPESGLQTSALDAPEVGSTGGPQ